jgi:hypothetical protein
MRGKQMRKRERNGWTLVVFLSSVILVIGIQTAHSPILDPTKPTQIVKHKATMKEKRENRAIAKTYARIGFGWSGREWSCLNSLWTTESRFDNYADNSKSTAYGIAQLLGERSNNPRIQILRGLRYIDRRYSTPCKAWKFHIKHNYY